MSQAKLAFELLIYHIYIYCALFLAILFKPTTYTCLALFLYVFFSSWMVANPVNCTHLSTVTKVTVVSLYTLCCVVAYKIVYYIYWKNKEYVVFLFLSPFLYFLVIKGLFHRFHCNTNSNINLSVDILRTVVQQVPKLK
jgi:hypothetical protein